MASQFIVWQRLCAALKPHLECSELVAKAASLFGAARCGCLRVEEQHDHLSLEVLQADAFSIVRLELPAALQLHYVSFTRT